MLGTDSALGAYQKRYEGIAVRIGCNQGVRRVLFRFSDQLDVSRALGHSWRDLPMAEYLTS